MIKGKFSEIGFSVTHVVLNPDSKLFNSTLAINNCLNNGINIDAWYTASSIDILNNKWIDISGNNNDGIILQGGEYIINSTLNGHDIIYGTIHTQIVFNISIHPTQHTIFNLVRYSPFGNNKGRILQTTVDNAFFGFWDSKSGVAYCNGWITDQTSKFDDNYKWILSSQQRNLYRGNMINYTIYPSNLGLSSFENKLAINFGIGESELSDFGFSELIVFNHLLNLSQIKCIERYFDDKYILPITPLYLLRQLPISSFTWSDTYNLESECQLPQYPSVTVYDAWRAENNDNPSSYLQANLTSLYNITSVSTWGRQSANQFVTSYDLSYSIDGDTFISYGLLTGNSDTTTQQKNFLIGNIIAQYLRFTPITWSGWKSMRIETSGVEHIPTMEPSSDPTNDPTNDPTLDPTSDPTQDHTVEPTTTPSTDPTQDPTTEPTFEPTSEPTTDPTEDPTTNPTTDPSQNPTEDPTRDPTDMPTYDPTMQPTMEPTLRPSRSPLSGNATFRPTYDPTLSPTTEPTYQPTLLPTTEPTYDPTIDPTEDPTSEPTNDPTTNPTFDPTADPTKDPTKAPTTLSQSPTFDPTDDPTDGPTYEPTTMNPTNNPTTNSPTTANPTTTSTQSDNALNGINETFISASKSPTNYYTSTTLQPSPTPICGSTITGATTYEYDIDHHYFTLTESYMNIVFNSCGSGYDTYLYFQTSSGSTISECDDCGDCGTQTILTVYNTNPGDYRIGIGGYQNNYGSWTLSITCSTPTISWPNTINHSGCSLWICAHGDNVLSMEISNDDGLTYSKMKNETNWQIPISYQYNDILSTATRVRFKVMDQGGVGGFIASIQLKNPASGSHRTWITEDLISTNFPVINSSDNIYDYQYTLLGQGHWANANEWIQNSCLQENNISIAPYWVWNNQVANTMTFTFSFMNKELILQQICSDSPNSDTQFIVGTTTMTWHEAEEYCQSLGSNLVTIANASMNEEVKSLCEANFVSGTLGCWIGLYYNHTTSLWEWNDDSSLNFGFNPDGTPTTGTYPWIPGQPDSDAEDCTHLWAVRSFNWNDAGCTNYEMIPVCNPNTSYGLPVDPSTGLPTTATIAPTTFSPTIPTSEPTFNPTTTPTYPSLSPSALPTRFFSWSPWFGVLSGEYGGIFQGSNDGSYINKIIVRHSNYLDAIQVEFTDGTISPMASEWGPPATYHQEKFDSFTVNDGQCFSTAITYYSIEFIYAIQFKTTDGMSTPIWGENYQLTDANQYTMTYGDNYCISKLEIFDGWYIDRIRFYFVEKPANSTRNPTANPTTNPTEFCQPTLLQRNISIPAIRNQSVGTIDIYDTMIIEMDVVIGTLPTQGLESVFYIGRSDEERWPAIWLHDASDNTESQFPGFYVSYGNDRDKNPVFEGPSAAGSEFSDNTIISYKSIQTQSQLTIIQNGEIIYDEVYISHPTTSPAPSQLPTGAPSHSPSTPTSVPSAAPSYSPSLSSSIS